MIIAKIKSWASKLKNQGRILQLVYEDPRTPFKARILIWVTLGYLFSPIDLIPDFIPILGLIDDIIVVPLLIALIIKLIPKNVMEDARAKLKDHPNTKWKKNWIVILFIFLAWVASLYLVIKLVSTYFDF